jgi:hypothetical protein
MTFQKPRILTDRESNIIRGKCLLGKASREEIMQLIGHFDLVEMKLRDALETLSTCMPDRIFVMDDKWSNVEPSDDPDEYETINFTELLGG